MHEYNSKNIANFLGIGLDAITYEDLFKKVDTWILDKTTRSHHIACINAHCVTLALKNERLARIYNGADIAGPDGMPFVKWIRIFLKNPCDRIAAPDTILQLARHSKTTGYTFYLYGGDPQVIVKMKEFLEEKFPNIRIVGYRSPPFRLLTSEEDAAVCDEINRLKPDIICVGLGTPKQDYWIEDHLYKIRGSVFIAKRGRHPREGNEFRKGERRIRESTY